MSSRNKRLDCTQQGFTVVELMVASIVFSVILLLIAGTIVRFTNNFQKGVVDSSTQTVARNIVDTIAQAIQTGDEVDDNTPYGYCIGTTAYIMRLNVQLDGDPTKFALKEKRGAGIGCDGEPDAASSEGQELLGQGMRLAYFEIEELPGTDLQEVFVTVAYGDNDILDLTDPKVPVCKPERGSQFCSVRKLSVTVKPWL